MPRDNEETSMTDRTPPTEEYPEPPDDAFPPPQPPVVVPAAVITSTLRTLNLLDEFFRRHASTAARAELRAFAEHQGWDPIQGAEVLIEGIGLDALSLDWARDATHTHQTDPAPPSTMDHPDHDTAAATAHADKPTR
jgi:hypothetical protein